MKDRDPVEHYMSDGMECIDAMKAISTPEEYRGYLRLTAFKYLWRLGNKDEPAREAKKALDYITWLHEEIAAGEPPTEPAKETVDIDGVIYEIIENGDSLIEGDGFSERSRLRFVPYSDSLLGGEVNPRCDTYLELRPVK